MNYALILAAGVGQRMRNGGMPKQFLKMNDKPIIIYTLEKFQYCEDVDKILVVCHSAYVEHMQGLIDGYHISKVEGIIVGGADRQGSIAKGLEEIKRLGGADEDIVIIHDGVRPLVSQSTIEENIRITQLNGCAVTAHPVNESVVITDNEQAGLKDIKKRAATYSMTSPQTFLLGQIADAYKHIDEYDQTDMPLLDAAMVYAQSGRKIHLVKEQNTNIKITTPEDYYILRAMLELEENKFIFGL